MPDIPITVSDLINRFKQNIDVYKKSYNETMLRKEFIDPFFEALGWDVSNKSGYAEAYKDVIHEATVKIGGTTKAPDYAFRIGGIKKFFLEAKKPAVDIKGDIHPAYQLRRYAWSAKLPLSILTDFEEFAVYDCRIKPVQTDKASTARIMYISFEDYPERWDEITAIFAKEAVLKGSFDRYIESTKRKRGTAEVDSIFLKEIEVWRDTLARNIALRNLDLSQRELNFAVARTIDRIIFLRICEDRGMEDYGQLMSLQNGTNIYKRLVNFYRRADEKYNSGLFHFRLEKDRQEPPDELTPRLTVDDKIIKDILKQLYYPDSPYEFSVLPADILGHIYEQFLGKVIRLTPGHHAKVEAKPEVRKAGGVYYTPTYIVDYIVKNTVGKLLEKKTPRQAAKLKILDPACGSGSFLIGAYQYLLDWHRDWYVANDPEKWAQRKSPTFYRAGVNDWLLTTVKRKEILLNNIYGVDIDPQAVEVTKLSLLLKVLEGESSETINRQRKLFHERALPDLGNNIKCGNSLIGPDFYDSEQISLLDEEEQYRINAFDWEAEFPEVFKKQDTKRIKEGKKGPGRRSDSVDGFDVVIGNPPYGAEFTNLICDYMARRYNTFVWRGESYLVFVEKAIRSLSEGGMFGYIIPDTFLNLGFTQSLRSLLLRFTILREIVVLPSRVFPKATVDTTLLFAEKSKEVYGFHDSEVKVLLFDKKEIISSLENSKQQHKISTSIWYNLNSFNVISTDKELIILNKVDSNKMLSNYVTIFYGIKVYQIGKGKPPQTKEIRDKKPFTSLKKEDNNFSPFFEGKHIGRYNLLWEDNNWINYGPWLAEPRTPDKYDGEKILIRKIVGETLIATYHPSTSYCNTLLFTLKIISSVNWDYKYLLGVINSKFIGWYYRKKYQINVKDTFPQIMIRDIEGFPVPLSFQKSRHDKMVKLVDRMLDLHKQLAKVKTPHDREVLQRQINATDKQIDKLVYELYDLAEEEIRIVEFIKN